MDWAVVLHPESNNEAGRNLSGIIVCLTDGAYTHEVARVAFAREHSRNPKAEFQEQLSSVIHRATTAADAMNEFADEFERQEEIAVAEREAARVRAGEERTAAAKARIKEILGTPSRAAKGE